MQRSYSAAVYPSGTLIGGQPQVGGTVTYGQPTQTYTAGTVYGSPSVTTTTLGAAPQTFTTVQQQSYTQTYSTPASPQPFTGQTHFVTSGPTQTIQNSASPTITNFNYTPGVAFNQGASAGVQQPAAPAQSFQTSNFQQVGPQGTFVSPTQQGGFTQQTQFGGVTQTTQPQGLVNAGAYTQPGSYPTFGQQQTSTFGQSTQPTSGFGQQSQFQQGQRPGQPVTQGQIGQQGQFGAQGQPGQFGAQGQIGQQGQFAGQGQTGQFGAQTGQLGQQGQFGGQGQTGQLGAQTGQQGQQGQFGGQGQIGQQGQFGGQGQPGQFGAQTGQLGQQGQFGGQGQTGQFGAQAGQQGQQGAQGTTVNYPTPVMSPGQFVGTLIIRADEGKFFKNLDLIGKMDPYVIMEVGTQKFKTEVAKGQGLEPKWTDVFTFKLNGENQLKLSAYDHDFGSKDDLIGETVINLADIVRQRNTSGWYQVFSPAPHVKPPKPDPNQPNQQPQVPIQPAQGPLAGQVKLSTEWIPFNPIAGTNINMPTNYHAIQGPATNVLQTTYGQYYKQPQFR